MVLSSRPRPSGKQSGRKQNLSGSGRKSRPRLLLHQEDKDTGATMMLPMATLLRVVVAMAAVQTPETGASTGTGGMSVGVERGPMLWRLLHTWRSTQYLYVLPLPPPWTLS